ncbi:MAG: hypothetical protein ABI551_02340, partial [Polyangiaceae bacterium]
MADPSTWTVLPHGPIRQLAENLWHVSGNLSFGTLKRAMTVAKRADGKLVVHSAIAMNEAEMKSLEALGELSYLVVPNAIHRLDAAKYKARYPHLKVYAPRGSRKKVEEVVAVDGTYEDFPADDAVALDRIRGVGGAEGVMRAHSNDGVSLVFCDAVFNMDKKEDLFGWLFTTLLGSAPGPRVSRLAKLALVKDKKLLRAELERLAETPDLERVIVSHEKIASGPDAKRTLLQAATF